MLRDRRDAYVVSERYPLGGIQPLREDDTMANADYRVTIHMAESLDGFIARKDGNVDWLETPDKFVDGNSMDPGSVEAFLKTIDCCFIRSRTHETAFRFEARGLGVVVRR